MSLESNKTLGGIGAILTAIGSIVPLIGIVGIILVLIALKGLAEYYNENSIFQNALYGIIFYIIGIIIAAFVVIGTIFSGVLAGLSGLHMRSILALAGGVLIAAVVMFVFYILGVIYLKKSFNILSAKSGEGLFNTVGLLLLIGAILTIIIIGSILMLVAWIVAAVGFFSIKSAQPSPPPPPPHPPP